MIAFMTRRETTSVGSATAGSLLMEQGRKYGGDPVLRHPRHLNAREFQTDNFIILGSRLSVPWLEMLEPELNYAVRIDPRTRELYLQNRYPAQNEPARYNRSPSGMKPGWMLRYCAIRGAPERF